jgi:ectoine hydroxylase-related dioxygenase (phytanoyl-CoA dioxygenase family)
MQPLFGEQVWYEKADCNLDDLRTIVENRIDPAEYPHCDMVEEGAIVYGDGSPLRRGPLARTTDLKAEIARALSLGPGVVVVRGAFENAVIDRASDVYFSLIDRQKQAKVDAGDHFGAPGSNDRLWSALEKLALTEPEVFCDYYRNEVVALVASAWLGPNYQVVSEINCVNPGSPSQVGHRDYHLGNFDLARAAAYPIAAHLFTPALTLQVAVAHTDMPLETGPTMFLPHSHKFGPGFLAMDLPEFQEFFTANRRQIALRKGDVLIFNPAVMHAAGANSTNDVRRLANLLQISSAFSRPYATVSRGRILQAIYPVLRERYATDPSSTDTVIAAAADGYPYPTNMDLDPPTLNARVPESQADLARRGLAEAWSTDVFVAAVEEQVHRRRSSFEL